MRNMHQEYRRLGVSILFLQQRKFIGEETSTIKNAIVLLNMFDSILIMQQAHRLRC